ncbi:hypothetical protein ACQP00_02850 [Dactylosporangium sp. CS-047395]|uniref:hypothetical protein n=1 Tax=Dactylosporangium sp. CS-047395 TaxID=3239936 RepID=UPI003D8E047F
MAGDALKQTHPLPGAALGLSANIMEAVNARSTSERGETVIKQGLGLVTPEHDPASKAAVDQAAGYVGMVLEQRHGGGGEDSQGPLTR